MAPQIEHNDTYSPSSCDLFALGTILFVMRAGHPPFVRASSRDQHYRCIISNRLDKFWKSHFDGKEEGFFSNEFIELFSWMVQLDQSTRLTIPEIRQHPWFKGPMPSEAAVEEEFRKRWEVLNPESVSPERTAHPSIFEESGALK